MRGSVEVEVIGVQRDRCFLAFKVVEALGQVIGWFFGRKLVFLGPVALVPLDLVARRVPYSAGDLVALHLVQVEEKHQTVLTDENALAVVPFLRERRELPRLGLLRPHLDVLACLEFGGFIVTF